MFIHLPIALAFTGSVLFFHLLEAWAISEGGAYLEQEHCAYDQQCFLAYGI